MIDGKHGKILWGLALFLCFGLANAQPLTEYSVKAAFLHNFLKFINWPAAADKPMLELCLLGQDHFGEALTIVDGKLGPVKK
jgi:hypothetical protein